MGILNLGSIEDDTDFFKSGAASMDVARFKSKLNYFFHLIIVKIYALPYFYGLNPKYKLNTFTQHRLKVSCQFCCLILLEYNVGILYI
jgi:hypothetical protein